MPLTVALFLCFLIQTHGAQFYWGNLQNQCHSCPVIPCLQYLDLRLTSAPVSSDQTIILEDHQSLRNKDRFTIFVSLPDLHQSSLMVVSLSVRIRTKLPFASSWSQNNEAKECSGGTKPITSYSLLVTKSYEAPTAKLTR